MYRTTISLESPLEKTVRGLASRNGMAFSQLINELIKRGLKSLKEEKPVKKKFKWNVSHARPVVDFDPSDRESYDAYVSRIDLFKK